MTKIQFVLAAPNLPKDSVGALPKTMYLAGEHYARIEQPADLTSGQLNLLIVRERDIWLIDILKKAGTHSVNSSPDFAVQNPILGPDGPTELFDFQYGREVAFFEKSLTKELTSQKIADIECEGRELTVGSHRILLYTNRAQSPIKIQIFKDGAIILQLNYISYQTGLPFDGSFFTPPQGVQLTESAR